MKLIKIVFKIFIIPAIIISCRSFPAGAVLENQKKPAAIVDGILIKYKDRQKVEFAAVPADKIDDALRVRRLDPAVEYAEPDYLFHASLIPTDTYYNNQWYLKKIKAEEAWNIARESPNIVIAIIDSGVQISHPDLRDNIWVNKKEIAGNGLDDDKNGFIDDVHGWDFVNDVPDPSPKFKEGFTEDGIMHGTIVAGVAAASGNNAAGVVGVTWRAQIMPLKALDDKGEGSAAKVVKAIDYATDNGADIINLSFVGFNYSRSLYEAIKRAYDAGVIVVAAAGNEQGEGDGYNLDNTPIYPACYRGDDGENIVIGVAATDAMDQKSPFSSYGSACVDISAPGYSIFSTVVYDPTKHLGDLSFNRYYNGYWSGTSMAAPMVSAALALAEEVNPKFNSLEVVGAVLDRADNIVALNPKYIGQLGSGRLNVKAAVSFARQALNSTATKIIVTPRSRSSSTVSIADMNGRRGWEFVAYENFTRGLNAVAGFFAKDSPAMIITAPASGGGPHIKIFDSQNKLSKEFFAYAAGFRGGVNLAAGDIDGDGVDEIITAPASGGGPHIKIFNAHGRLLSQFFAYAAGFRGGVNLAAGDIDGDGVDEIITAPASGGGPHIKVFDYRGHLKLQFFAYDKSFRGGVKVAVASLEKGAVVKKRKIVTAPASGGGAQIKIFDNQKNLIGEFLAFNRNFRGGVSLATGDLNNDGLDEIVVGAGPGGGPHVRTFTAKGELIGAFYAFAPNFTGGVSVSTMIIKL